MIAVPSYGPLVLDLKFDDTRVWGTVETGASGAFKGDAQGRVLNGGAQLEMETALSGPGCPEGLTVSVSLNVSSGRGLITFRLNGGSMSGSATVVRAN